MVFLATFYFDSRFCRRGRFVSVQIKLSEADDLCTAWMRLSSFYHLFRKPIWLFHLARPSALPHTASYNTPLLSNYESIRLPHHAYTLLIHFCEWHRGHHRTIPSAFNDAAPHWLQARRWLAAIRASLVVHDPGWAFSPHMAAKIRYCVNDVKRLLKFIGDNCTLDADSVF